MWADEKEFSGTALSVRCYESHPGLKFGKGKLYGGSASHPVVKDADVYVALQSGSSSGLSSDPWEKQAVVEVHYAISDMHAPKDVPRFKKLVTWICNQLQNGLKVHVGCLGGHGRTGLVLSAVVAEALGKKDAIQYVRKHYCKKAVESKSQVQFLMKHYDVSEVEPTKSYDTKPPKSDWFIRGDGDHAPSNPWDYRTKDRKDHDIVVEGPKVRRVIPEGVSVKTKAFVPMASVRSLWKGRKREK